MLCHINREKSQNLIDVAGTFFGWQAIIWMLKNRDIGTFKFSVKSANSILRSREKLKAIYKKLCNEISSRISKEFKIKSENSSLEF
jgi:hypothetical protein